MDRIHLLADQLGELEGVTRVDMLGRPSLFAVRGATPRTGPLLVVWEQRDSFHGENEPPVAFDWPWPAVRAIAVDPLGQAPLRRRPRAAPSIAASR